MTTLCSSDFSSPGSGAQQPATINPVFDLCTIYRYPLPLGGPRQCGKGSLPDTFTHDQHWELTPRPSDLEFIALSTWPYVSAVQKEYKLSSD